MAMNKETMDIDVTDVSHVPELPHLAKEVKESKRLKSLRVGDEEVSILMPPRANARPKTSAPTRRRQYLREDDASWHLVGMSSADDGPIDISANKHRYLAEAYTSKNR